MEEWQIAMIKSEQHLAEIKEEMLTKAEFKSFCDLNAEQHKNQEQQLGKIPTNGGTAFYQKLILVLVAALFIALGLNAAIKYVGL